MVLKPIKKQSNMIGSLRFGGMALEPTKTVSNIDLKLMISGHGSKAYENLRNKNGYLGFGGIALKSMKTIKY